MRLADAASLRQFANEDRMQQTIFAGGPGSGCHGDNCGRPAGAEKRGGPSRNIPKLLREHGWNAHGILDKGKLWSHPKHGFLKIRLDRFRHVANPGSNTGTLVKGKKGVPLAHQLKEYLDKLKDQPAIRPKAEIRAPEQVKKDVAQQIKEKLNPTGIAPKDATKEEQHLASTPVKSSKELGGGITTTKLLTFADGTKGVFKEGGARSQADKEVKAWEAAKIVGMEDMTSAAVPRDINGIKGAVLDWKKGELADQFEFKDRFGSSKNDIARAAMFDFALGNGDRHSANWLVENGKVHLIDNGLAFSQDTSFSHFNWQGFYSSVTDNVNKYDKDYPVAKYAKPYIDNADKLKYLASQISDGASKAMAKRIATLQKAKSWNDLA